MFYFPFLCRLKFCSGCFRQVIFHLGEEKVIAGCIRQVVVLYSNDCMGICLGRLSIGCFRQVIVLPRWSFDEVSLYANSYLINFLFLFSFFFFLFLFFILHCWNILGHVICFQLGHPTLYVTFAIRPSCTIFQELCIM